VEAFIDWCWLGAERFTEPFFENTIDVAQSKPFNRLFTHRTPIAELGEWYEESPGLMPSGFIFHMSRCGSTLVSQMLAALPENLVISEAAPLDRLARAFTIPEATRAEWLRWMVSALGQRRSGRETRYFIKLDSPTVLALGFIRRVFPSVPWIFIYRNPEEVLISHLRSPAPAVSPGFVTDINVTGLTPEEAAAMTPEEYGARVLGNLCKCGLRGMDRCGLPINYAQLPEAVWGPIAGHFGVAFTPGQIESMRNAASSHAKRPRHKFQPDAERKRMEVSEAARVAIARWVQPYYQELEQTAHSVR
jgi:hypothetical protein